MILASRSYSTSISDRLISACKADKFKKFFIHFVLVYR